jgi:carboxyl-terminal processing protease
VGIEPDIQVTQLSVNEVTPEHRRAESDYSNALRNDTLPKDKKSEGTGDGVEAKAASQDAEVKDYQLSRALDILRGVALYRQRDTVIQ